MQRHSCNEHDVFISYRVACEVTLARMLAVRALVVLI